VTERELLDALTDAVAFPNQYRRGRLVADAQIACEQAGILDDKQRAAAALGRRRREGVETKGAA
jgi:hypothetical protein